MNLQKYAIVYSAFHRCNAFDVSNDDTIVLPLGDMNWEPYLTFRLHKFEKTASPSQLSKSLSVFFNSESQSTTFLKQDSWTILLGNERVIFPKSDGQCKLYATPYFVSDPRVVDEYLRGSARPTHEHVFSYKNTILYLDRNDVPFPGGCYFDEPESSKELFRLCFLSRESGDYMSGILNEWKHRQGIHILPFHVRSTTVRPSFIDFQPIQNLSLPDEYSKSTGTLRKHVKVPSFIIQDVILSYLGEFCDEAEEESQQVYHLGLVLEWPLHIQYDGSRIVPNEPSPKQFVCLAINGSHPKNVLYVREPYERYVEYEYVPPTLPWTEIYFQRGAIPDYGMLPVVIDSVVIGFEYKESFLCLSYPLLEDRPRHPSTQRTECMLTTCKPDSGLVVLETFHFDSETVLHHVRPKNSRGVQWDLWCLTKTDDDVKQYPKRVKPPHLVEEYLNLYSNNKHKEKYLGNVKLMQLATELTAHHICFKTRLVEKKRGETLLSNNEIIFQMERPGIDFLNSYRLTAGTEQDHETEDSSCTIA